MKFRLLLLFISCFLLLFSFFAHSAIVYVSPESIDSPPKGEIAEFNINVKDVKDLSAYQIAISFDKAMIKLTSIQEGNFLKTGFGNNPAIDGTVPFVTLDNTTPPNSMPLSSITANTYASINSIGKLIIANSRYTINELKGVDGEGTLISLKFEVIEPKASKIMLNAPFDDPNLILVNSKLITIDTQLAGATINETQTCLKGDVDGNGVINSRDALIALQISAQLIVPNAQQLCAGDINEDGSVMANDAIRILRKSVGLEAPIKEANNNAIALVRLGEVYGNAGNDANVPLYISQSDMIAGGDISINYDPNVLRAVEVIADKDMFMVSNISKAGTIKISFADTIDNNKPVAEIKFKAISDSKSSLTLQNVTLYRNDLSLINTKLQNGFFISWAMPAKDNALMQNFPNPFNPETWIPFQLKQDSDVSIKIYSAMGELIRELDLGNKPAGMYISQDRAGYWDGKDKFGSPVASGVYFYSIKTKDFSDVKKLIVLK